MERKLVESPGLRGRLQNYDLFQLLNLKPITSGMIGRYLSLNLDRDGVIARVTADSTSHADQGPSNISQDCEIVEPLAAELNTVLYTGSTVVPSRLVVPAECYGRSNIQSFIDEINQRNSSAPSHDSYSFPVDCYGRSNIQACNCFSGVQLP